MTGRPLNEHRALAIELGFRTYEGIRHYKCGTTERYVRGGSCVHCAKLAAQEKREAAAYYKAANQDAAKIETPLDSAEEMVQERPDESFEEEEDEDDAEARRQASFDELM